MKRLFPFVLAVILSSCSPATNGAPDTGLQGKVMLGPITPVCKEDEPCDAPFSALFHVLENAREVSRFQSNSQGEFNVALDPGLYLIVPDRSAPLMASEQQRKEIEVRSNGMTPVTLYFDTGIR